MLNTKVSVFLQTSFTADPKWFQYYFITVFEFARGREKPRRSTTMLIHQCCPPHVAEECQEKYIRERQIWCDLKALPHNASGTDGREARGMISPVI
jgi:hypothetical protein